MVHKKSSIKYLSNIANKVTAHGFSGSDLMSDELKILWVKSGQNKDKFINLIRMKLWSISNIQRQ
jgi:hypothetical protein